MPSSAEPLKAFETGPYRELATRPDPEGLILTFSPPLVLILEHFEKTAGEPLNQAQVERIRDQLNVIVLPEVLVKAAAAERGYGDINPAHAWEEWQKRRLHRN